jgi:hypothetical protein
MGIDSGIIIGLRKYLCREIFLTKISILGKSFIYDRFQKFNDILFSPEESLSIIGINPEFDKWNINERWGFSSPEITFRLNDMKIRSRKGIFMTRKFCLNKYVPLSFPFQLKKVY